MKVNMAHLWERSVTGGRIDFAVFDAKSTVGVNNALLARLTARARGSGLRVDQSALVYQESGQIKFYGTPALVDFLSKNGVPQWTHQIDA